MSHTTQDRVVRIGGALLALALVAMLLNRTTQAAFSATTDGEDVTYTATTIELTDNDADGVQTTFPDMVPGDRVVSCIEVTYTGASTDLTNVRFYVTDPADVDGTDLDADLDMVVTSYTGADCTGTATPVATDTLDGLQSGTNDYASSADGQWEPGASGESHWYEVAATLGTDTDDGQQGKSGGATLFWELRTDDLSG